MAVVVQLGIGGEGMPVINCDKEIYLDMSCYAVTVEVVRFTLIKILFVSRHHLQFCRAE